jgi:hypothetical protein
VPVPDNDSKAGKLFVCSSDFNLQQQSSLAKTENCLSDVAAGCGSIDVL